MYKRKRCACGLCKPHKRGLAPKKKTRERMQEKLARQEIRSWLAASR